jgi:hypothetical protein
MLGHPVDFWNDVHRGAGLTWPMVMAYALVIACVAVTVIASVFGIRETHRVGGPYSGMLLSTFWATVPTQVGLFIVIPTIEAFAFGTTTCAAVRLMDPKCDANLANMRRVGIYAHILLMPFQALTLVIAAYLLANPAILTGSVGSSPILSICIAALWLVLTIIGGAVGIIGVRTAAKVRWYQAVLAWLVGRGMAWIAILIAGRALSWGILTLILSLGRR